MSSHAVATASHPAHARLALDIGDPHDDAVFAGGRMRARAVVALATTLGAALLAWTAVVGSGLAPQPMGPAIHPGAFAHVIAYHPHAHAPAGRAA